MSAPQIRILSVEHAERGVAPELLVRTRLAIRGEVLSAQLVAQVRIEPRLREWTEDEQRLLRPLFGLPELWERSAGALLWTQQPVLVRAFTDSTEIDVPLPVTASLEHAVGKLCAALDGGDLPIALSLRGAMFQKRGDHLFAAPVPESNEAAHRLPVRVVREALDRCYAGRRPLSVDADVHDRLSRYRLESGASGLDEALDALLSLAGTR